MNVFSSVVFDHLLLAAIPQIWYALPLIVVVSLVYGATRHENLREIFTHSLRNAIWCVGFYVNHFLFNLDRWLLELEPTVVTSTIRSDYYFRKSRRKQLISHANIAIIASGCGWENLMRSEICKDRFRIEFDTQSDSMDFKSNPFWRSTACHSMSFRKSGDGTNGNAL